MSHVTLSDARNDTLLARVHSGLVNAHAAINFNLELMRAAFTKPMPLCYFDDLASTPGASNWPQCLAVVEDPGAFTHIDEQVVLSDGADWVQLDDSDARLTGTGTEADVKSPVEFPDQGGGSVVSAGRLGWDVVVDGCFDLVSKTTVRPWPVPVFAIPADLPDPANWAGSLAYCASPESGGTGTVSEKIRVSNGTRWLALDGSAENVDVPGGGWAALGSRPADIGALLADIAPADFTSGDWASILNSRFVAWADLWTKPLPLPVFTQAQFFSAAYAANPAKWKWCLALVSDAQGVTSGAHGAWLADEAMLISTGTAWKRFKDSSDPLVAIRASLEAWWQLGEASGTRVDSHGSNDLADNNTVGQVAGKVGNAALFVRANSEYLDIADNASLSMGDIDFTIACWVKLTTKPAGDMAVCGKWNPGGGDQEYVIVWSQSLDRFVFQVSTSGTNSFTVVANALGAPSVGVWYWIVAGHDAAGDVIFIRVNNGTQNTTAHSAGVRNGTARFIVGAVQNGAGAKLDAAVDELGVWKKLLSAKEREVLYNGGNGLGYDKTR